MELISAPEMETTALTVELLDGCRGPQIGFGVYELREGPECEKAVEEAIAAGYRHFDTAQHYYNEHSVAVAMTRSGLAREEFFVTTKTPWKITRASIHAEVEATLERTGWGYIDLYLIHWPTGDAVEAWRAMEELQAAGKVRSIGVSNFTIRRFQEVLFPARLSMPVVNQIEMHPYFQQPELVAFCREHGIRVMAYSPLARSEIGHPPELLRIAEEVGRSPAQVMLRWGIQNGFIVLPKSRNPQRMRENLALGDFALSDGQMAGIARLDKNQNVLTFRPGGFF
jgi:diketogulonate reductase-like aldo/keto reductase